MNELLFEQVENLPKGQKYNKTLFKNNSLKVHNLVSLQYDTNSAV